MNQTYRKNPIQEEMEKNIETFNITVTVEKDLEMTNKFSHIPNFIAFKTTLRKDNQVIGIGTGASVLSRLNKFLDRTVLFAKNSSLIDAIVRSTKVLDVLSIMPTNQKEIEEVDLEGRNKTAFFGDEDLPQEATSKQRNFLSKLVENCDDSIKKEYLEKLESPYLSKFEASELINSLLPVK
ncbi:MAG: hypothetical protein WC662_00535 [Candidatus Paceibacterota bacterium]|jgi:hypothetical protein